MSFLKEVKRRKVFQVAAIYAVVAWLILQIVDVVSGPLLLPDWFSRVVIVLLAIGFPISLIFSWAFDVTAQGVVRDEGDVSAASRKGRQIEYILLGLLLATVGWIGYRELSSSNDTDGQVLPNSVAVLPCDNLSPDPDDAYFAAGMHDEILNQLAKVRDLNVIARTTVLQYAGNLPPLSQIASELRVEAVMECSVRYAGDSILLTAQLIDPVTNSHLWSETFPGSLSDLSTVFAMQADIAMNIAGALRAEFSLDERQSIEQISTDVPEAFALYLKANSEPRSSIAKCRESSAVGADPAQRTCNSRRSRRY